MPDAITVRDAAGAWLEAELLAQDGDGSLTVRTSDGRTFRVPADAIERRSGSDVRVRRRLTDFGDASERSDADAGERVVPIVEEEAVVDTRTRTTGTIDVRTWTEERRQEVEEILSRETVDVERVPIDRVVERAEGVREEGDTTVVPLYEEVLVVEKRLLLREELRLTKRREERTETESVLLRGERVEIEHDEPSGD